MAIFRRGPAQGLDEPFLTRSGREQIPRPHDPRDAHLHVVYRDRQLIGEYTVGAADDEVSALAREVFAVRPVVTVLNGEHRVGDNDLSGGRAAHLCLFSLGVIAALAAHGPLLAGMRRAGRKALRARAPAGVDEPECREPFKGRFVAARAQALTAARFLRPAEIPVEAEPAQVLRHEARVFIPAALRVQVFQAEEHLAAQGADIQPGQQG